MGNGNWAASTYTSNTKAKIASGQTFDYSRRQKAARVYEVHPNLDPKKVAGPTSPFAGQIMRESRDNAEHPNSVPVAVCFDVTGSMGIVPEIVQKKLGTLFGLLLRKGYVEDPQILISAYGDSKTDHIPLQVSQFESDNRVEEEGLDYVYLEGNGGGNNGESMSLAWYYLAHHTSTDAWEKRGKKGYAFFVADEISHELTADVISRNLGEEAIGDITNKALAKAVAEKWDVYIMVIKNAASHMQGSKAFYENLFGVEHVLEVEDAGSIAETMALTIGVMEGTVNFDDAVADLKLDQDADPRAIQSASNAVALIAKNRSVNAAGNAHLNISNAASGAARI